MDEDFDQVMYSIIEPKMKKLQTCILLLVFPNWGSLEHAVPSPIIDTLRIGTWMQALQKLYSLQ